VIVTVRHITTVRVIALVKTYRITLDDSPDLLACVDEATQPAESDKLAWIKSHALRKTTATALDGAGHTARQIADQLGQAKVSITQDIYMGRRSANPAAAQASVTDFQPPVGRMAGLRMHSALNSEFSASAIALS
jgi:integrase